jgi:hypothetical protein
MEADRTTAVEGLAFVAKDQASPVAQKLSSALERVHHATERSSGKLREWGRSAAMGGLGAVGLGFGLRELFHSAKEANQELEGSAKRIAGVHFAFGGWRDDISGAQRWNYALAEGTEIVEKLERSEDKLKMGRGQLADIYKSSYALGQRHHLNQQQMLDMTEKLGAAERVLGTSAQAASMSISRAVVTGSIRGMDDFNKSLRFGVGNMKEFHKLSESQRFAKIQKALGDLMPAAAGMGKGISGAMFDIREAIQDVTRDVTGPAFREVSKELQTWAKEVTRVKEDGKSIAREYGDKLVKVFHAAEKATKFIAENWRSIALVWGSMKFASWAKGPGGAGVAGLLGGAAGLGGLGTTAAGTTSRLATMGARVGLVTEGLGLLYLGAQGLAAYFEDRQRKSSAEAAAAPRAMTALTAGAKAMSSAMHEQAVAKTMGHLRTAFEAYGLKPGQMLSRETLAAELKAMAPELAAQQLAQYGIRGLSAKTVGAPGVIDEASGRVATLLNNFAAQLIAANPDLAKGPSPHVTKAGDRITNIGSVHLTQEFKEADPDRVWVRAVNEIDQMVHNPRGSMTHAVGG